MKAHLLLAVTILKWVASSVTWVWSLVLCFQANPTGVGKLLGVLFTVLIPVLPQVAWAWWAVVHGNAYIWAFSSSVALFFIGWILVVITGIERERA